MFALRDFLNDYQVGDGAADGPANTAAGNVSRKEDPLSYSERLKLQEDWVAATSFVRDSKRLHEGVLNALEEADRLMQEEIEDLSLRQIQTAMSQWIEGFIENKIVYAQDEMVRQGIQLLSKQRDDTVMIIGINYVLERLFVQAHEQGYNITVIVVDTCPNFAGRALVKRLSAYGVKCIYTLI